MTKITNSTRVKAPNIQALDFRSHTTVNSRIIDATSLNPSGRIPLIEPGTKKNSNY